MAGRIWDRFLTDRDRQVFEAAGYGQPMGFGRRPGLLVIDVNYNFCGDGPEPILDSIKRWPNSCGEDAWRGVAQIRALIVAARRKGVPVIYSTGGARTDGWDWGSWHFKVRRLMETAREQRNVDGEAIVAEIAPAATDIVIRKLKPSMFHGTPLRSYLQLLECDSVIVTGTTTSGCVRATVIDAFSENYRVTVAEEGCFDRSESSHAINLMDMNAKYADVRPVAEVLAYLESLPAGLFKLPAGE